MSEQVEVEVPVEAVEAATRAISEAVSSGRAMEAGMIPVALEAAYPYIAQVEREKFHAILDEVRDQYNGHRNSAAMQNDRAGMGRASSRLEAVTLIRERLRFLDSTEGEN